MGKRPRLGTMIKDLIEGEKALYLLIEKAISYYRTHGKAGERFGHLIDRVGIEPVEKEILGT